RDFARQLLDAVHAVHAAGTVHRDLKPANLLVDATGRVTIVDFGFASTTRARSQWARDGAWGSLAYMAPEAMLGRSGPASDWYSVGVVLYEMATGELPPPLAKTDSLRRRLGRAPTTSHPDDDWLVGHVPHLLGADVAGRVAASRRLAVEL